MGISSKPELRQQFLTSRNSFSDTFRRTASVVVIDKLLHQSALKKASIISSFISYGSEVDTHPLIDTLVSSGKQVAVPRVSGRHLSLRRISSISECKPGIKGILEPPAGNPEVNPSDVEVIIVPGLAFDSGGYRLGYGGGYYDRLLESSTAFKIGICFTDQMVYRLPHDSHDIRVDLIVTDSISVPVNPNVLLHFP